MPRVTVFTHGNLVKPPFKVEAAQVVELVVVPDDLCVLLVYVAHRHLATIVQTARHHVAVEEDVKRVPEAFAGRSLLWVIPGFYFILKVAGVFFEDLVESHIRYVTMERVE